MIAAGTEITAGEIRAGLSDLGDNDFVTVDGVYPFASILRVEDGMIELDHDCCPTDDAEKLLIEISEGNFTKSVILAKVREFLDRDEE